MQLYYIIQISLVLTGEPRTSFNI